MPYLKKAKIWNHIYVLFLVLISFALFASEDMASLMFQLKGMFGLSEAPLNSVQTTYYLRSYAVVFVIAILGSTPLLKNTLLSLQKRSVGEKLLNIAEPIALVCLLLVMTGYLVDGSFSPFLYFRF